jgi:molybdenum cofactor guanylyltransferase
MPPAVAPRVSPRDQQRILGVVLAGGKSSRMGRDKATLIHTSGATYLEYAISRLAEITRYVAVSGRKIDQTGITITSIPDQSPALGPAMAVWSAIQYAADEQFAAILVTPIDMPDLESQHLRSLIEAMENELPTCATFDGKTPHPLVAIYPVILERQLGVVAQSAHRSLRQWLSTHPCQLVMLPDNAKRDRNT